MSINFQLFRAEPLSNDSSVQASRFSRSRAIPKVRARNYTPYHKENPSSCKNRASHEIDQGDTIGDLRRAWGIPAKTAAHADACR